MIENSEGHKISVIMEQQNHSTNEPQFSRDSCDIQSILKSQIFKDQNFSSNRFNRPNKNDIINANKTIAIDDLSYKKIQISALQNPSILLKSAVKGFSQKQSNQLKESTIQSRFTNINSNNLLKREKSQGILFGTNFQQAESKFLKKNLSQRNLQIQQIKSPLKLQKVTKLIIQPASNSTQSRIPKYLRQVRKLNTIYPNFYFLPKSDHARSQFTQKQNKQFKKLLQQFKKCLQFLNEVNQRVYIRYEKIKKYENILLNSMTIQTFLKCGWQKIQQQLSQNNYKYQLDQLKPHQNFIRRKYQYEKVKGALNNYIYISQYYQKNNLNLIQQKGQKKYLQIRKKFGKFKKILK